MSCSIVGMKADSKFKNQVEATPFTIFEPVADLGYYGWKPKGLYKSLAFVSAMEMIDSIDLAVVPDRIVCIDSLNQRLPMRFASLAPQEVEVKYPYSQFDLASLHVTFRHRGVDMKNVNFFFGGSTLQMLATMSCPDGAQYLALKVPGTDIVMVVRHRDYVQNYSNIGFQFERLVTGNSFDDRHKTHYVEHLQLMKVDGFGVLFSAECDAVDSEGKPVEIKASNPVYWGTKVMFQMISNGSSSLYVGEKSHGYLTGVRIDSLLTTATTALATNGVDMLENNIRIGLETLNREAQAGRFSDGSIFVVGFRDNRLELVPFFGSQDAVMPSRNIVDEMLS